MAPILIPFMSIDIKTGAIENDIFTATVTGHLHSLPIALTEMKNIFESASRNGFSKILIDQSEMEFSLRFLDVFEIGRFVAQDLPKQVKVGFYYNSKHRIDMLFAETVAVNRGLNVKVFTDLTKVIAWLNAD